jgi:hypothetical protein
MDKTELVEAMQQVRWAVVTLHDWREGGKGLKAIDEAIAFISSHDSVIDRVLEETARADRYAERLEITSHWVSYDDGVTLTRVEVPREDWDTQIDGIDCRDETIKLQDAAVDNLRDQLTAANEKLAAARERDLRLVEWLCCLLDEVKPDDATKAQAVKFLDAFNTGDGNKNP